MMPKFKQTEIGSFPENWEIKTLDQSVKKIIKHMAVTSNTLRRHRTRGFRIISPRNIKNSRLIAEALIGHIDRALYEELVHDEIELGDILLVSRGPRLGECMIWKSDEKIVLDRGIFAIRPVPSVVDPEYLFWFMKSRLFQSKFSYRETGMMLQGIRRSELRHMRIVLPPLREQKHIAKFLSDLDSKIQINKSMIGLFEEICMNMFRYWFVGFEFPRKNGQPYLSSGGEMIYDYNAGKSIPKNWNCVTLRSIIEFVRGKEFLKNHRYEEDDLAIGSRNMKRHSKYRVKGPGIIIRKKGTTYEPCWKWQDFLPTSTTFYVIDKLNSGNLYFHYFLLKEKDLLKSSSDSVIREFDRNDVYSHQIILPPLDIIKQFHRFCAPFFQRKLHSETQIRYLSEIQDSLLSKLISGKIQTSMRGK